MAKDKKSIRVTYEHSRGMGLHYYVLYSIIRGMECNTVLELGAGMSTPTILQALDDQGFGRLFSIDVRDSGQTGVEPHPRLSYLTGTSLMYRERVIEKHAYEVVFHDASHTVGPVVEELRWIVPRIKRNGLLLIHDTWYIENAKPRGLMPLILDENLSQLLGVDMECVTLPYGFGLTICRIRQDFGHGAVKSTWKKGLGFRYENRNEQDSD